MSIWSDSFVRRGVCITLILVLMALDQVSKWWIIEVYFKSFSFADIAPAQGLLDFLATIPQDRFPPIRIEQFPFFNLVMVWNEGVSFGMFAGAHDLIPILLIGLAIVLSTVFFTWMWRAPSMCQSLPLAMIVAGALSNAHDRMRFGAVADFFDFHVAGWHYPAFNIADMSIVVGVFWLIFDTLILEKRRHPLSQPEKERDQNA
jgi:signal peptidase II